MQRVQLSKASGDWQPRGGNGNQSGVGIGMELAYNDEVGRHTAIGRRLAKADNSFMRLMTAKFAGGNHA
jgi:hypothetical protein